MPGINRGERKGGRGGEESGGGVKEGGAFSELNVAIGMHHPIIFPIYQ